MTVVFSERDSLSSFLPFEVGGFEGEKGYLESLLVKLTSFGDVLNAEGYFLVLDSVGN